jgi:hypothetical protein
MKLGRENECDAPEECSNLPNFWAEWTQCLHNILARYEEEIESRRRGIPMPQVVKSLAIR